LLNFIEFDDKEISSFYKNVADNVKNIRKSKGITQLDLALTIGHKSVSTIGKIEASLENKHYNLEHLYKISKVLEVDLSDFFKKYKESTS